MDMLAKNRVISWWDQRYNTLKIPCDFSSTETKIEQSSSNLRKSNLYEFKEIIQTN